MYGRARLFTMHRGWHRRVLPILVAAMTIALCGTSVAAAQAPSGRAYVSDPSENTVSIIDVLTGAVVATVPVGNDPGGLVVSPDGSRVYVIVLNSESVLDNVVAVIDTATGDVVATVPIGHYPVNLVASPDASRVYVAAYGEKITVIDTATNSVVAEISAPIQNFLEGIAVSADPTRLYWVENASNHYGPMLGALVVAATDGTVLHRIQVWDPFSVLISPDGTRAYVSDVRAGGFSVVDLTTNTVLARVPAVPFPSAVSPDGSRLYAIGPAPGTVSVVDAATYQVLATIAIQSPRSLTLTPDGAHALVIGGTQARSLSIIELATNTVVASIPVSGGATDLAFGPAPAAPTSADQCKNGGWRGFAGQFRNQGACVSVVRRD